MEPIEIEYEKYTKFTSTCKRQWTRNLRRNTRRQGYVQSQRQDLHTPLSC